MVFVRSFLLQLAAFFRLTTNSNGFDTGFLLVDYRIREILVIYYRYRTDICPSRISYDVACVQICKRVYHMSLIEEVKR